MIRLRQGSAGQAAAAPLFTWHERHSIGELAAMRGDLAQRILLLRPRSTKRLELEAIQCRLTARQLQLENDLAKQDCVRRSAERVA